MKDCKFSLLAIFLTGMFLTSCKKETEKEPEVAPPAQSTAKLFEHTLQVSDAEKTRTATLRFRASSKELLTQMALEKYDFVLVKTPAPLANNAKDLSASSAPGIAGFTETTVRNTAGAGELPVSGNVVYVDIPFEGNTSPVSIEVRSKAPGNSSNVTEGTAGKAAAVAAILYYHGANWHRIRVKNTSPIPISITVRFYRHVGPAAIASGLAHNLTQNTSESYSNCNYSVGAKVTFFWPASYRVTWWPNC